MPIVLPYREKVREDLTGPGYRQNLPTGDPGLEAVTRGVDRVTDVVGSFVAREKAKHRTAQRLGDFAKLGDAEQELLEHAETGLFRQKGEAAVARRNDVVARRDAIVDELRAKVTDEDERLAFGEMAASRRAAFMSAVDKHVAKEADSLAEQKLEGGVARAVADAELAARTGDDDAIEAARAYGRQAVEAFAKNASWDADYKATKLRAFEAAAHAATARSMLAAGLESKAKAYLEANAAGLDEKTFKAVQGEVTAGVNRADAGAAADLLWSLSVNTGRDPLALLQAASDDEANSGKIEDVKADDAFLGAVRQRIGGDPDKLKLVADIVGERWRLRNAADGERMGRLRQGLIARGWVSTSDPDYVGLTDDNRGRVDAWVEAHRLSRSRDAAERRLIDQRDRDAEADFRARDLLGVDGEDQASVDILSAYSYASDRMQDLLTERQKKVQKARVRDNGVSVRAFDAKIAAATPKKWNKKRTAAFRDYMRDAYWEWGEDPKNEGSKAPPPEWVDDKLQRALVYGERARSEGFLQPNMHAFEAERQGVAFEPFEQPAGEEPATVVVPDDDRAEIIRVYKKRHGRDPSDDEILVRFQRAQSRQ